MSQAGMDKWLWILIFGGLIAIGVGLSVGRSDAAIGWVFQGAGLVALAAGVAMLWTRSRQRDRSGP